MKKLTSSQQAILDVIKYRPGIWLNEIYLYLPINSKIDNKDDIRKIINRLLKLGLIKGKLDSIFRVQYFPAP